MKAAELREKNNDELIQLITEGNDTLMRFRLQMATGQVDNVCECRDARRNIARIKTILNERNRAELSAEAGDGK